MRISPDSNCEDGELEVFILHEVSRPRLLKIFPTVYKGEHVKFSEVEIFKAKSVRLENDNYPISCDGEIVGIAPFSVEIHPGALQVFSR
jgi:diacylglycerol kinase (ATP)